MYLGKPACMLWDVFKVIKLRRDAISDSIIRNIRIHEAECPYHGIIADRHLRHYDAVAAHPATLLQRNGSGLPIDGRNGINRTVRTDLHEILYI